MNHALQGRGGKNSTFEKLRELGEQICDPDSVVAALGLASGLDHNVTPINGSAQDVCDLPWMRWRALRRHCAQIKGEAALLSRWRERLYILFLLIPYSAPESLDLTRLWTALCFSPDGRRVCQPRKGFHLGLQLHELLFASEYKQCKLTVLVDPSVNKLSRAMHPACQCFDRPSTWLAYNRHFPGRGGNMAQASVGHICNEVCQANPQRCPRHTSVRARTWVK